MQFDADAPVFEPLFTSDGVQTLVNERAPQGKPKYTQRLCKLQINNCDHGFYSGSVDVINIFLLLDLSYTLQCMQKCYILAIMVNLKR